MADIELNTIVYYKTEIDSMMDAEATRVNAELDGKADADRIGAPSGIASLGVDGKLDRIEIPFATLEESGDETSEYTVMSPKRVLYQIDQRTVSASKIGAANGVAPLGADGIVPATHLPPTRVYKTYVVAALAEMYALPTSNTIYEGDRAIVTGEVDTNLNGEYVAGIDTPSSGDWKHLPTLSAVTSVNGMTGNVTVSTTSQGDQNAADINALELALDVVDSKVDDRHTIISLGATNIDDVTTVGLFRVTTGLPDGLTESLLEVMMDKRTVVSGGYRQKLLDNADGIYATRTTIDDGATWSAWDYDVFDISSAYYDFEPQEVQPTTKAGRVFFDSAKNTLSYYASVDLQPIDLGTQQHLKVYNNTGAQIPKGSPIRYGGSVVGGVPTVAYADASSFSTANCQGMAMHDIPNGTVGYVATFGVIYDVDTTAYPTGSVVYVAEGGGLTTTPPSIEALAGYVITSAVDGQLFMYSHPIDSPSANGHLQKNAAVLNLSTTPINVVNYDVNGKSQIESSLVNGTYTAMYDGNYKVELVIDGLSDTSNREVEIQLYKNATKILDYGFATNIGANKRGSASFSYTLDLVAGDTLSLKLVADGLMVFSLNVLQFTIKSNKLEV